VRSQISCRIPWLKTTLIRFLIPLLVRYFQARSGSVPGCDDGEGLNLELPLAQSASVCGVAENRAIAAIKRVAEEAGFEMTDIVSVTVYVTDLNDVPRMNEVYRKLIYELKKLREQFAFLGRGNMLKQEPRRPI